MGEHHVAAYYNSLRERYALPFLKNDHYVNLDPLSITEEHLQNCARYIEKKINPLLPITIKRPLLK